MAIVKGIYKGNSIELCEWVKAKDGVEVEVIFQETAKVDRSFITAMKQELERMDKGFRFGGGPYYQSRDELHER